MSVGAALFVNVVIGWGWMMFTFNRVTLPLFVGLAIRKDRNTTDFFKSHVHAWGATWLMLIFLQFIAELIHI